MKIFIPIVDAIPGRNAYTNRETAIAEADETYAAYVKEKPFLKGLPKEELVLIDEYELIEENKQHEPWQSLPETV